MFDRLEIIRIQSATLELNYIRHYISRVTVDLRLILLEGHLYPPFHCPYYC